MKHIRIYESYKDYKKGDYVLLKSETKWNVDRECKILNIQFTNGNKKYQLQTFLNNKVSILDLMDNEIGRKLTKDEIEEYEIKQNMIKYNL